MLYIEDNPANQRLMHRILGSRPGWEIIDATDAETGIALAMTHRPDVIMMDIGLPGMDGYAALECLRADQNTAGIPVVALSANAMPDDIRKGVAAGFDEYLTKPLDVPNFLSILDKVLATGKGHEHE